MQKDWREKNKESLKEKRKNMRQIKNNKNKELEGQKLNGSEIIK